MWSFCWIKRCWVQNGSFQTSGYGAPVYDCFWLRIRSKVCVYTVVTSIVLTRSFTQSNLQTTKDFIIFCLLRKCVLHICMQGRINSHLTGGVQIFLEGGLVRTPCTPKKSAPVSMRIDHKGALVTKGWLSRYGSASLQIVHTQLTSHQAIIFIYNMFYRCKWHEEKEVRFCASSTVKRYWLVCILLFFLNINFTYQVNSGLTWATFSVYCSKIELSMTSIVVLAKIKWRKVC